jgi:adenine-specific DNA methylase
VPPFDQPITTTKATAIYNMHTYWSQKPHDAIRQYISHYTKPGDIVLDPFCGSGGTALAALMEGRAAIAIDLSPAATFITKNYCTPVDVEELQRAFEALQAAVKPEMDWLYETRCDRCDGRATTAYTVYSYVFRCPRCLERVPLFDCVEVMQGSGDRSQGGRRSGHARTAIRGGSWRRSARAGSGSTQSRCW